LRPSDSESMSHAGKHRIIASAAWSMTLGI
jgi:hypothetical protein